MKTLNLEAPGRLQWIDAPPPSDVPPGYALIQVRRVGICGTDVHAYRGSHPVFQYPKVPGHELGAQVVQVGPNASGVRVGDRCAVEPYLTCGQCIACKRGKTNCCISLQCLGVHVDGGMRPQMLMPIENLHPSRTLTFDQLALVETLGIGAHAVERANIQRDETALIVGAGPIGLSIVQFLKPVAARLIVMDVSKARLAFCRAALGIEHLINVSSADAAEEELKQMTGGDLPTAVFDATGNFSSMSRATDRAASGGRIVFVGLVQGDIPVNDGELHRKELTILASRNSTASDFRRIIRLIEDGVINTSSWITHRAPFERAIELLQQCADPDSQCIKAMIELHDCGA